MGVKIVLTKEAAGALHHCLRVTEAKGWEALRSHAQASRSLRNNCTEKTTVPDQTGKPTEVEIVKAGEIELSSPGFKDVEGWVNKQVEKGIPGDAVEWYDQLGEALTAAGKAK